MRLDRRGSFPLPSLARFPSFGGSAAPTSPLSLVSPPHRAIAGTGPRAALAFLLLSVLRFQRPSQLTHRTLQATFLRFPPFPFLLFPAGRFKMVVSTYDSTRYITTFVGGGGMGLGWAIRARVLSSLLRVGESVTWSFLSLLSFPRIIGVFGIISALPTFCLLCYLLVSPFFPFENRSGGGRSGC